MTDVLKKKPLEEPEALICFKKEAVTLWVGGTFLKNPELIFFFVFFLEAALRKHRERHQRRRRRRQRS